MAEEGDREGAISLGGEIQLDAGHAFRMRLVDDVVRKMHREKQRFENAADRREQVDAAINFAITAWHLSDWVWQQHQDALRGALGVECLRDFQQYLRQQSRHLAVCDVIANAAKHGGFAHPRDGRPDVETVLVAHSIDEEANSPPEVLVIAMMKRGWSLKIRVDGKSEHAIVVFNSVYSFWHRFIQRHCRERET